ARVASLIPGIAPALDKPLGLIKVDCRDGHAAASGNFAYGEDFADAGRCRHRFSPFFIGCCWRYALCVSATSCLSSLVELLTSSALEVLVCARVAVVGASSKSPRSAPAVRHLQPGSPSCRDNTFCGDSMSGSTDLQ